MGSIIFDFDGTLADSLETIVKLVQRNHKALGCPKISLEEIEVFKHLHAREVLKKLNIPWWRTGRVIMFLRRAIK